MKNLIRFDWAVKRLLRNKTNFKYRTFYRYVAFQNDFDRLEFLKKYLNELIK